MFYNNYKSHFLLRMLSQSISFVTYIKDTTTLGEHNLQKDILLVI